MNPVEQMNQARQTTTPVQRPKIDELQYLIDKAARLASEAAAVPEEPEEPAPVETEAERQRRLIAAMTDARSARA
jgi:hypothetical protein